MGPWTRKGVALHPWSHCGTVAVAPDGTMIQPRLWCSPVKYPNGTGSCNAGVRSTIPSGMPNAGQRCVGGASPCGFRLHEGQWEPCRNSTDRSGAAKLMPADSDMRGVGRRASADAQPCVPGQPASVSFAVTRQAAGEWIENFTAPIVGPNSCPRSHSPGHAPRGRHVPGQEARADPGGAARVCEPGVLFCASSTSKMGLLLTCCHQCI